MGFDFSSSVCTCSVPLFQIKISFFSKKVIVSDYSSESGLPVQLKITTCHVIPCFLLTDNTLLLLIATKKNLSVTRASIIISGRESNWTRNPSLASACHTGSDLWTKEPCLLEGRLYHNSAICASAEDAKPPYSWGHPSIHLRILPWSVLRHR